MNQSSQPIMNSEGKRFRTLCLMGMFRAWIDLQLSAHLLAEGIFREHPLDGSLHERSRLLGVQMLGRDGLEPAGKAGVMDIRLGAELVAGERDLSRVDH